MVTLSVINNVLITIYREHEVNTTQYLTNRETFYIMVVTLYKIDGSPPVRAVLMTVEILGLKIETKEINTLAGEQYDPSYVDKNPTHTVPMIEDGDFVLADSHAIITYLVSKYGAELRATLYPVDLRTRATIDQRMYVDATLVFPKFRELIVSVMVKKEPAPSDEQIKAVLESYGFIETYLERSPFLATDHITLADIAAVATISSLHPFIPVEPEKFPKITEWWEKIKAKDWYQKANVPGLAHLEGFIKGAMEKNSNANSR